MIANNQPVSLHQSRAARLAALRASVGHSSHASSGPGTELRALLATIGIHPMGENCRCNEHAREMDRRGPDWCLANLDTIVNWLAAEAKTRPLLGVFFSRAAARQIVLLAIQRARTKAAVH